MTVKVSSDGIDQNQRHLEFDYSGAAGQNPGAKLPRNVSEHKAILTGGKARAGEGQRGTKRVGATNEAPKNSMATTGR